MAGDFLKKNLRLILVVCFLTLCIPTGLTLFINQQTPASSETYNSGLYIYINEGNYTTRMDMETFLVHALHANIPVDCHPEMMKVQAVILRTIILQRLNGQQSMAASQLSIDYDSTATIKQQHKKDYAKTYADLKNAVSQTFGEAIYANDKLILPLFFYCGTGITRDFSTVWGSPCAYMVSVDSPWDADCPNLAENITISSDDFIGYMQTYDRNFYASPLSLPSSVQIISRDNAGYVTQIQIGNMTLTGDAVMTLLSLPSAAFDVTVTEKQLVFSITGHGHGVGLSQYGANAMATSGCTYKEILGHYYTDTVVK